MLRTTKNLICNLELKNITHTIKSEEKTKTDVVVTRFVGMNHPNIRVGYIFSASEKDVNMRGYSVVHVPDEKRAEILEEINKLNNHYRWVHFRIDKDGDVECAADAIINVTTAEKVCFEYLARFISIIDAAYPVLNKVLGG